MMEFKEGQYVRCPNNIDGVIKKIDGTRAYVEYGTDVFMQDWGEGWFELEELAKWQNVFEEPHLELAGAKEDKLAGKEIELLLDFLDELECRYSNDGCNDWEWPIYFTQEDRERLMKPYVERNHDPDCGTKEEELERYTKNCVMNVVVLGALMDKLKAMLKE